MCSILKHDTDTTAQQIPAEVILKVFVLHACCCSVYAYSIHLLPL